MQGVTVPAFFYGTAWKEERTEALTRQAIDAGFRAIDTANQRRHYVEAGVGAAWRAAGLDRGALFLQTKFTYMRGQDARLPYDPRAPIAEQVRQSFASSLEHLQTDYVDSYVLHGPALAYGLADADWEAWGAMAELQRAGRARLSASATSRRSSWWRCAAAARPVRRSCRTAATRATAGTPRCAPCAATRASSTRASRC